MTAAAGAPSITIPVEVDAATLAIGERRVGLTHLDKIFFAEAGLTKRDLLQYYADVAPLLLPHVRDRAMVMKRYPHGADGAFFFMKRTPPGAPVWLEKCSIEHGSGSVIAFPIIDDLAALLWVVNLGCIDLNQWYARCDDVGRPDYLHFDLDPVKDEVKGSTPFEVVREAALALHRFTRIREDVGLERYTRVRSDRARTVATRRVAFCKSVRLCGRRPPSGYPHRRIQDSEAPEESRARRLQSKRVGPHARLDLFGSSDAARQRLDAGDVGRNRAWHRDLGFPARQRARAAREDGRLVGTAAGGEESFRSDAAALMGDAMAEKVVSVIV
jgi:hypothetical protein